MTKILLNFFVSWNELAAQMKRISSFYTFLWNHFETDLIVYLRDYVTNIHILRKFKEEARLNRILRKNEIHHNSAANENEDYMNVFEKNDHEKYLKNDLQDDDIHDFIFLSAFTFVYAQQYNERLSLSFVYFFFSYHSDHASLLSSINFQIFHHFINTQTLYSKLCDLAYTNNITIHQWKDKLTIYVKDINVEIISNQEIYEKFDNQSNSAILVSMIVSIKNNFVNQSEFSLFMKSNLKTIFHHITTHLSLNQKQYLICEKVLSHFLNYQISRDNNYLMSQMLLYIEEKEEVEKNQVIKEIFYVMNLLNHKNQLIIMNFIEAAIDNINEFTIHSFLIIEINKRIFKITRERIRRLWVNKTIMIIDDINMINVKLLIKINNNCIIIKSHERDIINFFDNISIVILMSDFFQLASMNEKSLWKKYSNSTEEQSRELLLWKRFENVIILDEQMRQAQDVEYRQMMYRARHVCLNTSDITTLNQKVITSLDSTKLNNVIVIVKRNIIRHMINRSQMKNFAIKHN